MSHYEFSPENGAWLFLCPSASLDWLSFSVRQYFPEAHKECQPSETLSHSILYTIVLIWQEYTKKVKQEEL